MQTDPYEANRVVGQNVAALRGEMSQAYVAALLAKVLGKESIDPTSITRLEKGTRSITVNELVGLAEIFSVDPMYLLHSNPESDGDDLRALRAAAARSKRLDTEAAEVATAWREAHDELATAWNTATESGARLGLADDAGLSIENETFVTDEEEREAWAAFLPVRKWPFERALSRYREDDDG